jgi:hypothetical protein
MHLRDYIYLHPLAKRAYEQLLCDVTLKLRGHMSIILAASRVGKTTLMREIISHLESLGKNVAYIVAPKPGSGKFSWRPTQRKLLALLGYPFARDIKGDDVDYGWQLINEYLVQEKIDVLIIDDADFLNDAKSKSARNQVANNLRSFAEECPARIVLTGTYLLQELVLGNAQLMNRSDLVYMRPYKYNAEAPKRDLDALDRCLTNFNNLLEIKLSEDVVKNPLKFYHMSLGCVGILAEKLLKAESYTKQANKPEISYYFIEKAFSESSSTTALTEINLINAQKENGVHERK